MLPFAFALACYTGDFEQAIQYSEWSDWIFVTLFAFSCVCGFILNYSIVLCTKFNSPLTTCCVGTLKNLVTTYVGMISSGDYIFQATNFFGINVSVVGSLIYTAITFSPTKKSKPSLPSFNDGTKKIEKNGTENFVAPAIKNVWSAKKNLMCNERIEMNELHWKSIQECITRIWYSSEKH